MKEVALIQPPFIQMKEMKAFIRRELCPMYPDEEIRYLERIIFLSVCKMDYNRQLLHEEDFLGKEERGRIQEIVRCLKKSEPLQYILGETEFYSLPFRVDSSVLIPRHETEELVDTIIKRNQGKYLNIIDIGTGSGCIAITLKKHLPESIVTATDISAEALQTAADNAENNGVDIHFVEADILNLDDMLERFSKQFDIIVSNPPYVMEKEKRAMNANVLNFEPHTALFVSDANPLVYYDAIAEFASQRLREAGEIFLEMNPLCSDETKNLMERYGYQTEILKDLSGKNRMLRAFGNR